MLLYGLLITIIGMLAVFGFLYLLMLIVDITSKIVQKMQKSNDTDKIVAVIAVALKQGGK